MKKQITTLLLTAAVASSALGQGLVLFGTGPAVNNRISTNSVWGGPATGLLNGGPNAYYFALFVSASQTTVGGVSGALSGAGVNLFQNLGGSTPSTGWQLVGMATNTVLAGRFLPMSQGTTSANQGPLNADFSMTVQGIAGGATANFVALGWSANMGSTLEEVALWLSWGPPGGYGQVWIGQSAVGVGAYLGNGAEIPTPNAMGGGGTTFPGFLLGTIQIVPEPGTVALVALGGAALLGLRRRK